MHLLHHDFITLFNRNIIYFLARPLPWETNLGELLTSLVGWFAAYEREFSWPHFEIKIMVKYHKFSIFDILIYCDISAKWTPMGLKSP
jgi:hypothetical protein